MNCDAELAEVAVILRDQVIAADGNDVIQENVGICIDMGYHLQAVELVVDFLGVAKIEDTIVTRLLRLTEQWTPAD